MNVHDSTSLIADPVIIIGAGRSGTNMLRDVLTRLDGVDTWPCDEINYIWRHGNRAYPTDEFTSAMATQDVVRYIRRQFDKRAKAAGSSSCQILVEKTCANSLRVPFVDKVVPEARYIHIVRDGREVVASAMKRWTAPLDIAYLAAKARYVPLSDLPYYAIRYAMNRFAKLTDSRSALSVWGPRFEGMQQFDATSSLEDICAAQWSACVQSSGDALDSMPGEKVHTVHYETFVTKPHEALRNILDFLGRHDSESSVTAACADVHTGSIGGDKMAAQLPCTAIELMRPALQRYQFD